VIEKICSSNTPSSINHLVDDLKNIAQNRTPILKLVESPPETNHPWGSISDHSLVGRILKEPSSDIKERKIITLAPTLRSRSVDLRFFVSLPMDPSSHTAAIALQECEDWSLETVRELTMQPEPLMVPPDTLPTIPIERGPSRELPNLSQLNSPIGEAQRKKRAVKPSPTPTQKLRTPGKEVSQTPEAPTTEISYIENLTRLIQDSPPGSFPSWLFATAIRKGLRRADPNYPDVCEWLEELGTSFVAVNEEGTSAIGSVSAFFSSDMKSKT
jgi:hypothetical protein